MSRFKKGLLSKVGKYWGIGPGGWPNAQFSGQGPQRQRLPLSQTTQDSDGWTGEARRWSAGFSITRGEWVRRTMPEAIAGRRKGPRTPRFRLPQANPAGPGPGKAGMKTESGEWEWPVPGQFEDGHVGQAADNTSIDSQGDGFQWARPIGLTRSRAF